MVYCNKCGKQNPDDASFCLKCGSPLPKDDAIKEQQVPRGAPPTPDTRTTGTPQMANNEISDPSGYKDKQLANWRYRNSRPIWYKWDPNDKKRARRTRAMAITAIVLLIMFATMFAFIYSADNGKGWFGSSATVYVKVTSAHVLNTVSMKVTINGHTIAEETLSPLETKTLTFKPWFPGSSATYDIVVTTTGGGLGDAGDSKTVTIDSGSTTNVPFLL
jgi:hypothetical protein